MDQINEVVSICLELVQQTKVSPSDIGVIAAFRQQVLKIRLQLRQQGLSNVNVGSVEDFQVCTLSLSPYITLYHHHLLPSITLYCSLSLSLALFYSLFSSFSSSYVSICYMAMTMLITISCINLHDIHHSAQHHNTIINIISSSSSRSSSSSSFFL